MYRKRVSTPVMLSFFIMMFLMVIGCGSKSADTTSTATSTYTISGTVSGDTFANVQIQLTGTATGSTMTGTDGSYSFTGLANGPYTVTHGSKEGFTFDRASSTVTVSGGNITIPDFVATKTGATYIISGTVTGADGVVAGVKIDLGGTATASTTTGTEGSYSFTGLPNGSYTVTPSLNGYTFIPPSSAVTIDGGATTKTADFAMTVTYGLADLAGTWVIHSLTTGSSNKWYRSIMTFNSYGNLTAASSCADSTEAITCPAAETLTWTISPNGVITESGTNGDSTAHMTMTSNKNFIAGTAGAIGGTTAEMRIIQKVGTGYSSGDVNDKSFVFHQLSAGSNQEWRYGDGATAPTTGAITMNSETGPSDNAKTLTGTISVDSSGTVAISSNATFNGFLSDDKKTIAGTYTDGSNYKLMIIQITGQTYAADALSGTSIVNLLAGGGSTFWARYTATVAGGEVTISDWEASNGPTLSGTFTSNISSTGTVTLSVSNFHGQMSDDKRFIAGTQTVSGVYELSVSTK